MKREASGEEEEKQTLQEVTIQGEGVEDGDG